MKILIALLALALLVTGCAPERSSDAEVSITPEVAASIEASSGAGVPADAPGISRLDRDGRSPKDVVESVFNAMNRGSWDQLYSLYATPTPDKDNATREWVEARERYEQAKVLEVRVTSEDAAFVRVAYVVTVAPTAESTYTVDVRGEGEWWPVHKVQGQWKVQWMPRQ